MDNFDLRKYLAENKLLKEEIDFPELEDEFEGAMDAMVVEPEVYLQDIIDASAEEIVSDDYYEIMNAVEQGVYSAEEAVKLAKAWAKNKLSGLAENKLLKEFVGKELEDRNEPLYDKLVPGNGDAETVEGEMLRAINRLIYRYYNDGDKYYEGYGTETAGPAHSFLVNANHPLKSMMYRLFKEFISDDEYERMLKDILDAILDHIESRQGEYTKNTLGGMFKYEPEFEDMEEDDDDYTYDYDDEEEEDYYQE